MPEPDLNKSIARVCGATLASVFLALAAVVLAGAWLGYQVAGDAALARLRDGALPAALQALQTRMRELPAAYVRDRADAVVALGMRAGALLWTALAVVLLRRRRPVGSMLAPRQRVMFWGGVALILAAPWLWLKLVGLALTLRCGLPRAREIVVSAGRMRVAWYAVFLAAYVCAPYWALPAALWYKLAALGALLMVGWGGAGLVAGELRLRIPASHWGLPVVVLAVAAFHAWPAGAAIPWMGDEDYHFMQVAYLCENMPPAWMVTLWGLAMLATGGATPVPRRTAAWLAVVAVLGGLGYPHLSGTLARYPFVVRWFEAAPVQLLYPFPSLFHQEALIRSSSVFCAAGLAAAMFIGMHPRRGRGAVVVIAALTLPLLQNYGSLLCLEMPALALLGVAAFRAPALMRDNPERVRGDVGWLALVLAGFTKETMLPVLAGFVASRAWVCWRTGRRWRSGWRGELRLAVAVGLPLAIYLGFRTFEAVFRGYPAQWTHWFHPGLWRVLLGSLWEQLGLLGVLAIAGTLTLRRWHSRLLVWWWVWIAAVALFTLGDTASFIGYSRYNLFLVPPLLAIVVLWLTHTRSAQLLVGLWLVANVMLSPLLADAARRAGWGTPGAQVGERYYPYREALDWLQAHGEGERILFAGAEYPYYLGFYFGQMGWRPEHVVAHDELTPQNAAVMASQAQCPVMVFHVQDDSGKIPAAVSGYRLQKIFIDAGSALVVYRYRDEQQELAPRTP